MNLSGTGLARLGLAEEDLESKRGLAAESVTDRNAAAQAFAGLLEAEQQLAEAAAQLDGIERLVRSETVDKSALATTYLQLPQLLPTAEVGLLDALLRLPAPR
ncbi:MAG: hypothetical protein AAFZ18_20045 [Myxococcota bacterium]